MCFFIYEKVASLELYIFGCCLKLCEIDIPLFSIIFTMSSTLYILRVENAQKSGGPRGPYCQQWISHLYFVSSYIQFLHTHTHTCRVEAEKKTGPHLRHLLFGCAFGTIAYIYNIRYIYVVYNIMCTNMRYVRCAMLRYQNGFFENNAHTNVHNSV